MILAIVLQGIVGVGVGLVGVWGGVGLWGTGMWGYTV